MRRIVYTLLMVLALCAPGLATADPGDVIDTVQWGDLSGLDRDRLERVAGFKPGAAINPERVAAAINSLASLPEVRQVAIRLLPLAPGKVTVRIFLEPVQRLERLLVTGADHLGDARVARAVRLVPGDEVDEDVLRQAAARVRGAYARRGFFDARAALTLSAVLDAAVGRTTLTVAVNEGRRSRIRHFTLTGLPADPNREADSDDVKSPVKLASRPGRKYDQGRLQDDMDRLRRQLVKDGYLHPKVGPFELVVGDGWVDVTLPVQVRERVTISLGGNRHFKDKRVLALLNLPDQRRLDDLVLREARQRLLDALHDEGYLEAWAEISAREGAEPNLYQVDVAMHEGRRHRIVKTAFEGHHALSEQALQKIVKGPFSLLSEPVRERRIRDRTKTIEGALRGLGYPQAKVTYRLSGTAEAPHRMVLVYQLDEGPRWTITQAEAVGTGELDPAVRQAVDAAMARLVDTPFRRDRIRAEKARIGAGLGEFGYIDAKVDSHISATPQPDAPGSDAETVEPPAVSAMQNIAVRFDVDPGPQVRIGDITLTGRFRTHSDVIWREIAFQPGHLYRPSQVAETRRRLFRAAAFDQVRINTLNVDDSAVRDVTIEITEGKPGSIDLGIGYGEKDGVRGLLDLSYRDLFHRGHRASLRLRGGQLRRLVSLTYALQWVGSYRANLHARLLYEDQDLVSFDQVTRAAELGIRPRLSRNVVLGVTYRIEFNRFPRLPEDQVSSLAGRRRINVGSILTSLVRDTRDDPFSPRHGSVTGLAYEQGAKALASEVQFGKATLRMARFFPVHQSAILAVKFQTGRVRRLFASAEVPVSERFFMGGQSTLRGYSLDSVGVPGETIISGVPQGGEVMILGNMELRLWGRTGWGLVLFADVGNVWNAGAHVGLEDLRVGAGPGLHYATPVGPVRLDLGYKIDPQPNEDRYRLHFTLGHTF